MTNDAKRKKDDEISELELEPVAVNYERPVEGENEKAPEYWAEEAERPAAAQPKESLRQLGQRAFRQRMRSLLGRHSPAADNVTFGTTVSFVPTPLSFILPAATPGEMRIIQNTGSGQLKVWDDRGPINVLDSGEVAQFLCLGSHWIKA